MDWISFENILFDKHIYTIDNNSSRNIVLFGSCHMATIGFMLNKLLNYEYNIHIIISWYFEKKGIHNFDMNDINKKIENIISNCDVFIYHSHISDYEINASNLIYLVKTDCLKLNIPNYRLDYLNDNYINSLNILNYHIEKSDFPEFNFVVQNHKNINFFNTTNHPTHYLLFLQSQSIENRIINNDNNKNKVVYNYFDINNRAYFNEFNDFVFLPGKENITEEISNKTGIKLDADYFDINNRAYFNEFNDFVFLPGKENITEEISNKTGIKLDADYFDCIW